MKALVASDDAKITAQLRDTLKLMGFDCPNSMAMTLASAPEGHAALVGGNPEDAPDLMFVVLSQDVEQSIATLRALRGQSGARIFAIGPATDPKLVLSILRQGADEFLDQLDLSNELSAAVDRLKSTLAVQQQSRSRLISLLPTSGGCGCSTLAASLAVLLAKGANSCILMDLNTEFGDLASLLDLKAEHNLGDLCQSVARLDRALFEAALVTHKSGVKLVTAPNKLAQVAQVTWEGIQRVLDLAVESATYVVVDLPHTLRDEVYEVLQRSDTILLVLRLDFTSLRHARRLMDAMRDLGISSDRVRVVVNRHRQPGEVSVADAETALNTKLEHLLVDDPKSVILTNNNGVPVVLHAPGSKLTGQIKALAASLQPDSEGAKSPKEPTVVPHRWFARRGS